MSNTMKFKTRLVAAALSAVWLSGCGSLMRSDYQAPEVQVPANWQQMHVAGDVSMDPWWLAFNDPTLNQYITQVLAQNNDLTLATLTLKKARLQLGLAQDDLFPTLSSSTSGQVQKSLDSGESADSYSTNLSVNYELDLWGKISADVDQAKWSAMASQQDREATAQSLVATTASLYWQIGYLQQRLNLSQRNVVDAAQTLQLIEKQYQLGAVDQLDVLEAKRTLASLQAQQSEFEQSLLEANNAFAILFNQPPKSISANIQMLPEGDMPSLSVGAPSDLLIRRPDIKAAKVVILDNLSSLYRSAEELIQNDWNFYNDCLDELREQIKAVLVLHHTDTDARNYRGHSEIARAIDNVLIAVKDKKASNEHKTVVNVRKPKSRHGANNEDLLAFEFGSTEKRGFYFHRLNN